MPSIPLQYGLSTLPFFKESIRDQSITMSLLSRSNQQIRFIITLTFLKISAVIHLNIKLYSIKYLMFIRVSTHQNLPVISTANPLISMVMVHLKDIKGNRKGLQKCHLTKNWFFHGSFCILTTHFTHSYSSNAPSKLSLVYHPKGSQNLFSIL